MPLNDEENLRWRAWGRFKQWHHEQQVQYEKERKRLGLPEPHYDPDAPDEEEDELE
jgi:hypothetical protein